MPGDRAPSAVAQAIARTVPALPDTTKRDLRRLLARHVSRHDAHVERQAKLGLLARLLERGEAVTTNDYESARRDAHGEGWPHHTTLIRAYGSWVRSLRAALLLIDPQPAGHPAPRPGLGRVRTRRECLNAIARCRLILGRCPSQADYSEWRSTTRAIARRCGLDHHPPEIATIKRRLGSWAQAIREAHSAPASGKLPNSACVPPPGMFCREPAVSGRPS